jgi:hypothetical protein
MVSHCSVLIYKIDRIHSFDIHHSTFDIRYSLFHSSLPIKPAVPVKLARSDFVLHFADTLFHVFPFPSQALGRVISGATMPAAGPLLGFASDRFGRIEFHQKRGQDIDSNNRPETGTYKQDNGGGSDPKYRKIKIIGYSPAHPQ